MQMISENSLQQTFIDDLIKTQSLVSVFLKNSIRLKGYLIAHNEEAVFLKLENIMQLVYKHKISTIAPEMFFSKF